jgi:glycosyltransferase involved in cell wall biosynthesis
LGLSSYWNAGIIKYMKIAIQAADLDYDRIDGTRVYLLNMLRRFGSLSPTDEFLIYHKNNFNPELTPPEFPNYKINKIKSPIFWTQARLAYELAGDKPDVLWMPMHNIPLLKNKKIKTVVTIHDLAYKYFPEYFPKKDLFLLNLLGDMAIKKADKIIAISESTKKDILKLYPPVKGEKIKVIYHGFDPDVFMAPRSQNKENEVKKRLGISGDYLLYSGAIQPRKNLEVLIKAFELFKKNNPSQLKLVLSGEKAWMSENIVSMAQKSAFQGDIIMPGKLKFCDLGHLMRGARAYVYPSLYEGFGITVLEALASRVPVICAKNSSLPEVGGDAVLYFDAASSGDLCQKIGILLSDIRLEKNLLEKGTAQIKKFSWDKCARETLDFLKS